MLYVETTLILDSTHENSVSYYHIIIMAPTTTTKTVEEPVGVAKPHTEARVDADLPKPKETKEIPSTLAEMKGSIDESTFEQILEMDDDDSDRDFSKGIVFGFFDQAESTFVKMEDAL